MLPFVTSLGQKPRKRKSKLFRVIIDNDTARISKRGWIKKNCECTFAPVHCVLLHMSGLRGKWEANALTGENDPTLSEPGNLRI